MIVACLAHETDFAGWREQARRLLREAIAPCDIDWRVGEEGGGLFDEPGRPETDAGRAASVPRAFPELAERVICHRDPGRFALLYRLLWRLQGERDLLRIASDRDVLRLHALDKAVRRDLHKMTAFVRFRAVPDEDGECFVAWFEPEHFILGRVAPFFTGRFAAMRWSILTPEGSLHWDGAALHHGPGARREEAPGSDGLEALWLTYYASIFNPARLKVAAMKAEMPVKYWRNLPEAALIAPLIADAGRRAQAMVEAAPTEPSRRFRPLPQAAPQQGEHFDDLASAAGAARDCRRCGLCHDATQTVFGEGPADAPVVFVGEQPGDHEDLSGRPFVGPAGHVFDRAMREAGLDRGRAYVTNAVKHFKFQLRGKRRIHQRPNAGEVSACRFWLGIELGLVKPRLVVALGATALQALTGRAAALGEARARLLSLPDGTPLLASVHPSYLLRLPDEAQRRVETERFIADLRRVGEYEPAVLARSVR